MDNTFQNRYNIGEIAVSDSIKILQKLKIPYKTCRQYFEEAGYKWSALMDKLYGDIVVYTTSNKEIWIDVKNSSISEESTKRFKGSYFWVFRYNKDHMLRDHILITSEDVFALNVPLEPLSSGSPGFKFSNYEFPPHIIESSKKHLSTIVGS